MKEGREAGRQLLVSLGIFAVLFGVLWILELCVPSLEGRLLQWSDPAFLVGIPASIIGVAYVFTIRNPKNYIGFYMGIVMAILLAVQFYLLGSWDLPLLYLAVFVPFMLKSAILWRRSALAQESDKTEKLQPAFLDGKRALITLLIGILIVAVDMLVMKVNIFSGIMCASSIIANYWLIYQKNDAWIAWVLYSVSGIIFNLTLPPVNWFSVALFVLFLYVNGSAQIAWLKMTDDDHRGWTKF